MRKSNSEATREAVRAYIMESIMDEFIDRDNIDTTKPATALLEIAKEEKFYQKYPSEYAMFKDWMQGLGCNMGADVYYHPGVKDLVAKWMDETQEEADKHSEQDAEEFACRMIYLVLNDMRIKEREA